MAPRELELDLEPDEATALIEQIEAAMTAADSPMVWATDERGRRHGLAVEKIVFVELEPDSDRHGVGFSGG